MEIKNNTKISFRKFGNKYFMMLDTKGYNANNDVIGFVNKTNLKDCYISTIPCNPLYSVSRVGKVTTLKDLSTQEEYVIDHCDSILPVETPNLFYFNKDKSIEK